MRMIREHGFSVIEVLIAMLLLAVVVAGVTLAFSTGSSLEQRRDLRSRMLLGAERVTEHLRSDKSWVANCRRARPTDQPRTCDLSPRIDAKLRKDDVWDVSFNLSVTATGVDNSGDGLARADTDGNVDDFFRIAIRLAIPDADKPRVGRMQDLEHLAILNGSTNSDSGALDLQICGAANQVDERIQIASCQQSPTYFEMPDCASPPRCDPRALTVLATPQLANPSRFVAMQPMNLGNIQLTKVDGEDAGMRVDASAAVAQGPGRYVFSDLPTGTWAISYAMPRGWRDWETHHVPSAKRVTVEKQRTANALVALRRAGSSRAYQMRFERVVRERWLGARSATFETPWIPECEQPASYNRNAFMATTVTCNTPHMRIITTGSGSMNADMEGLNDDVYQYDSWGYFKERVTVRYIGEVNRAQYVWQGAAGPGRFSSQAEPVGRYTEKTATDYVIPKAQRWTSTVQRAPYWPSPRSNSSAAPTGRAEIDELALGLNAPVRNELQSTIGNVSVNYDPPGCSPRFVWVAADGGIGGGSCRGFRMRGDDGECYTNMAGGWTGVNYYRRLGCNGIYWPPLRRTVTQPGYLVLQVCKQRVSQVRNRIDQDLIGYSPTNGDVAAFQAYAASIGATFFATGSRTLGGKTVTGPGLYKRKNLGTTTKTFDLGCEASPTVQNPMSCPRLDNWNNCSRLFVITFPITPGWTSGNSVEDGHRPANSGSSLQDLSG